MEKTHQFPNKVTLEHKKEAMYAKDLKVYKLFEKISKTSNILKSSKDNSGFRLFGKIHHLQLTSVSTLYPGRNSDKVQGAGRRFNYFI